MTHGELRQKLSDYLDDMVTADERAEIEAHLPVCPRCSSALAELQATVRLVRSVPAVEPPPWLAGQVMEKIRAGAAPKTAWWRRMFFPLYIKLPLEAVALIAICVTGYYVARQVPPLSLQAPVNERREEKPAAAPEVVVPPPVAPQISSPADRLSPELSQQPARVPSAGEPAPVPPLDHSPAPVKDESIPAVVPRSSVPAGAAREKSLAEPSGHYDQAVPAAPASLERSRKGLSLESAPAVHPQILRVTLHVPDPVSAGADIERAVAGAGGAIISREEFSGRRSVKARIAASSLSGLLDRFEKIGRLKERPSVSEERTGQVEVIISW